MTGAGIFVLTGIAAVLVGTAGRESMRGFFNKDRHEDQKP